MPEQIPTVEGYAIKVKNMKLMDLPIAHMQSILEVGNKYSVAHAAVERKNGKIHFIPVNPFKHKDVQFGADFFHYHIDGRFSMDAWVKDWFNVIDGYTNQAVTDDPKTFSTGVAKYKVKEIIYLNKKCLRLTTGVKPPLVNTNFFTGKKTPTEYALWYKSMIGKSCAGRKCPHFGTVMIEQDGKLICPMHNLKGDINKEIIVPVNY